MLIGLVAQTANSDVLLKSVSSFLAFVPPIPVAYSLFCTNSSTFLMSIDTKLFTVFEVAWLLSFVHLCRHCHLCSRETQARRVPRKHSVTVELQHFWCQRHHLTQFPSCLFSAFVLVASQSCLCKTNIKYPPLASWPAVSTTTAPKLNKLIF